MIYEDDKVKNIQIAYIGGGSKDWAWKLMSDLACEEQLSGEVRLYDIDYSAAKKNEIIGNKYNNIEGAKAEWQYIAVKSLDEALKGANFVIISITPGNLDDIESDVHTPEKYGIYQSVGDTTGPGGLMRSLRMIPMYIKFAENIKCYSPNAWVINYTNPMALAVRTLYEIYPGINAFGCCHEVKSIKKLLAKMLEYEYGYNNVYSKDVMVNVFGINHFTWINKASYHGIDLVPYYAKFVNKYYEEGFEGENRGSWNNDYFGSAHRVKFDLFYRYGCIAAAGDRHLAEFMPHGAYLKNPDIVKKWKFNLTPVSWRKQRKEERDILADQLIRDEVKPQLKPSGEEGVKQIKSILGLCDLVTNVNMPNNGQIDGIPSGVVVETNAHFKSGIVQPITSGSPPLSIRNLLLRHILNHEIILKSSLEKNKNLAFTSFFNDPLVSIGLDDAEQLFAEMLRSSRNYLSDWDI